MECDVCKQDNAKVFLSTLKEGKVQKVNLCEECAKNKGVTDDKGFDLADLLDGVGEESVQSKPSQGALCPNCGFSHADFKKTGRLGCSQCYSVFADGLEGLLKAMHKGTRHEGKVPVRMAADREFFGRHEELKRRLAASIESEQYEEAARIRDEMRQLESEAISQKNEV